MQATLTAGAATLLLVASRCPEASAQAAFVNVRAIAELKTLGLVEDVDRTGCCFRATARGSAVISKMLATALMPAGSPCNSF